MKVVQNIFLWLNFIFFILGAKYQKLISFDFMLASK